MNRFQEILKHPSLYLVGGLLIIGVLVWYNNAQFAESQRLLYATFAKQHEQVASIANILSSTRVPDSFAPAIQECEEQGEFDALLGQDSKYMDEETLTRALELHGKCASLFKERMLVSGALLDNAISTLSTTSDLIANNRTKLQAKKIISSWEKLRTLEGEKLVVYARNIELQKEFWSIERDKVTGAIPFETRELEFTVRNNEARANNARLGELRGKISEQTKQIKEMWETFSSHYLSLAVK
ncbi:MAG: hypothetical protein WDZ88_02345 [Candidatus Paceibacterota bacterium]